jgi:hypothetical protein
MPNTESFPSRKEDEKPDAVPQEPLPNGPKVPTRAKRTRALKEAELSVAYGGNGGEPDEDDADLAAASIPLKRTKLDVVESPELARKADPTEDELDEDEREMRALRLDSPESSGKASGAGIILVDAGKMPRREFFRTHPTFKLEVAMYDHEVGMETAHCVVTPNMVEEFAAIHVDCVPHYLYLTITSEGGIRWVPVSRDFENDCNRTKNMALLQGMERWIRVSSDKANHKYRVYPAPAGMFPDDPAWPDLPQSKIFRMGFRDRGNLIDSVEHPYFKKMAGLVC